MRLLSLDFDPVYGDDTTRSSFSSDVSVFDFDVVIWDPAATLITYTSYHESFRGLPSLSEHTSVSIRGDVSRRRTEFLEFINSGRTMIVIVRPEQQCYVDSGRREYSGTGRNQKTTRMLELFDIWEALPVSALGLQTARGNRIEVQGEDPLSALLKKYIDLLEYEAVISRPPGSPIAKVTGTERVVASVQRSAGGGYLILLPNIELGAIEDEDAGEDEDDEDGCWSKEAPLFQADLLEAIQTISDGKVLSRPAWAENYATSQQRRLRDEVVEQQGRIEAARKKLSTLQQQKEAAEAKDQFFLGSGRALELEVKAALELLGGTVTEPAPGRDDWRVEFPEGKAVVEVKGVAKSAAEKHAAQLEKWIAGAYEETGEMPKGILIVNTWRETPLAQRNKDDFPAQMLPYCKGRNHCLLTGLQLFVIRSEIEAKPSRAGYWRKAITKTAGVLPGADNWSSLLIETKPAE